MPNFRAKHLKELRLPFEQDGVKFEFKAENSQVILVYTSVEQESFFLQIKKDENFFVIKVEKHCKPSQIGLLQKALTVFKENFCEGVINEAFKHKHNAFIEQTPLIALDFHSLLEKMQKRVFVEIGFGSGRHLLYQAQNNPEVLVLGVEIYNPALTQVAKLAKAKNLNNILLIQSDARLLLSVLESNSVEKIFLHFPVPWDKKPSRRVVGEVFCKECARVLKENGKFELRTDSLEYFQYTLENFLRFKNPQFSLRKNENLDISSKYEDRWKRQEKDIYDLSVWNLQGENYDELVQDCALENLKFEAKDLEKIRNKFKRESIKRDNFFLHFDNLYLTDTALVLKLTFGAFNKPEHVYCLLDNGFRFLFKTPFKTRENLKAMIELKNFLEF